MNDRHRIDFDALEASVAAKERRSRRRTWLLVLALTGAAAVFVVAWSRIDRTPEYIELGVDGEFALAAGDLDSARVFFERAVAVGEPRYTAKYASGAGFVRYAGGAYAEGRAIVDRLIENLRATESYPDIWLDEAVGYAAAIREGDGEYERADSLWVAAWETYGGERIYASAYDLRSLLQAGAVGRSQGEDSVAAAYYSRAGKIIERVGDPRLQAALLHNLGLTHADMGLVGDAAAFHEEELVLRREAGPRRGEAEALIALGAVLVERDEVDRARALLQEAIGIFGEIGEDESAERARALLAGLGGG